MKKAEISLQTKMRLAASLKKFMQKKSFEKITVSEILEDCDIARPTFYYHFKDIYDLLEWTFENEVLDLLMQSKNLSTWKDGLLLSLNYIIENKKFCLCAYNSLDWRVFDRMLSRIAVPVVKSFIEEIGKDIPAKPEHIDFLADFYTSALACIYAKWLSTGMKQTPDEIVELIYIAIFDNIAPALERSAGSY